MNKTLPQIFFYFLIFPLLHAQESIISLDCGVVLQETTVDKLDSYYVNNYQGCYSGNSSFKGSDQAFVIQKPYDRGRLNISLFSEGAGDLDLFLFDTSFTNCIAASTNPVVKNQNIEAIFDTDPPLPAGTYYVVVDGNTNQSDNFRISAACEPLDFFSAKKLDCRKPFKNESTNFARNNINAFQSNGVLMGGNTGPENLYYFDLFFQEEVTITLDNFSSTDNFELVLLQDTDEYTGIAASINPAGKSEQIKIELAPGRYFVLVDGYDGTTGTYDLAIVGNCLEDQETGSIPIQCGETLNGYTVGFTNDFTISDYINCIEGFTLNSYEYNDALYRFDLEEAQAIQIELESLTEFFDLDIILLESTYLAGQPNNPQPGACIALGDYNSGEKRSIFENLKAGTYWISVDGGLIGDWFGPLPPNEGLFTVSLNCLDLPSPCDLKGEFIDNGTTFIGLGEINLQPISFLGIDCVEDAYNLENKLYGNVYTYYSEQADLTTIEIESENLDVNAFVFSCDVSNRSNLCIGETNSIKRTVSFAAKANSYYQIVVLSLNALQEYSLTITSPEGPCSNDVPVVLKLRQAIEGNLVGFGDDFNLDKSSFFQNCSSTGFAYNGEDRLFQLNIVSGLLIEDENTGQESFGTVTLEAESAMGLFLFNYQCGEKNCIAQIELPEGGGIDSLPLNTYINKEGTYYLVLDKADNKGSSNFKLSRKFEDLYIDCYAETSKFHTVSFNNGILLDQDIIENGDVFYIDYKKRQYIGETLYESYKILEVEDKPFSITSVELLNQDAEPYNPTDTINYQKCGFENGEEFEFKVLKKNGQILVLDPVFDDSPIFANPPTTFDLGATTLMTGIRLKEVERSVKIDFEPGNVNMNALPFTSNSFEGHIDVNSSWEILGLAAHPWIKIFDAASALENQPVTQGQGSKKILVTVDSNPNNEARQGVFEIVAENGFARRVLITQVANSCISSTINNITESITEVSCKGEANGAILLSGENIQTLAFNWDDGASGTARNNLKAGTYRVSVSDQSGCESVLTYDVLEPAEALQVDLSLERPVVCSEKSTLASIVISGGRPSYFINWSNNITGLTSVNLPEGDYQVSVTDENFCTVVESLQITTFPLFNLVITGDRTICKGESTILEAGSFQSYKWNTGDTSASIEVSKAGTYSVNALDENGCPVEGSVFVEVYDKPEPQITGSTSICPGGSTTLSLNGYSSYNWSTGESTSSIIRNIPGQVAVTVTNVNGCSGTTSVNVVENESLQPIIVGAASLCAGEKTTLDVGEFATYRWSTNETSRTVDVATSGEFKVTVTDQSGCQGVDIFSVQVNENPLPIIEGDTLLCFGEKITLSVDGTFASYSWSNAAMQSFTTIGTGGVYTLKVTDENACVGEDQINIFENPEFQLQDVNANNVSCFGFQDGNISVDVVGGTGNLSYIWDHNLGNIPNPEALGPGIYNLKITDENNCSVSSAIELTEPDLLTISIDTIRDEIGDVLGSIDVSVDGGVPPYSYFWDWQTGFLLTNQPSSGDLPSGVYQVKVEDANACTAIIANVVIDEIVSAHDFHILSNNLIIYPNPGKGIFHLDWQQPLEERTAAQLINVVGSTIKSFPIPKFTKARVLDLTDQPAGIYFLIIATSEGRVARKIVVE